MINKGYNPFSISSSEGYSLRGYVCSKDGMSVFSSRNLAIRAAYTLIFKRYRRQGIVSVKDVTEMFWHGNAQLFFAFLDKVLFCLNQESPISYLEDEDCGFFPCTYMHALSLALNDEVSYQEIYDVIRMYDLRPVKL